MGKLTELEILELEDDLEDIQYMLDKVGLDDLVTLKDLSDKKQRILKKLGRFKVDEKSRGKFVDWEF